MDLRTFFVPKACHTDCVEQVSQTNITLTEIGGHDFISQLLAVHLHHIPTLMAFALVVCSVCGHAPNLLAAWELLDRPVFVHRS